MDATRTMAPRISSRIGWAAATASSPSRKDLERGGTESGRLEGPKRKYRESGFVDLKIDFPYMPIRASYQSDTPFAFMNGNSNGEDSS